MAWTQEERDAGDTALKSNVRKVTFADGRSTEYQNSGELLSVRNTIKAELDQAAVRGSRRTRSVVLRTLRR